MTGLIGKQNEGEHLITGRLVPIRREGSTVYARSLRRGEEDTGEVIKLQRGDKLVIPAGELVIDSRQIDEYFNPKGLGGYALVANAVRAWYQIAPEEPEFIFFFFALARRTDVAHTLWALTIEELHKAREDGGPSKRRDLVNARANVEMAIIALHRSISMVYELVDKYCPKLQVPDSVAKIRTAVEKIRHAFEHINERAQGRVNRQKLHPDALTIFNQPDFIESAIIRYREYEFNLRRMSSSLS